MLRISSQKEKTNSNPRLREHATIVVSMVPSLLIVPLSIDGQGLQEK
jgi:hypothetical protein